MNVAVRIAMMLGVMLALPASADSTIYRCHALDGALLFQDKPCNQVPGTKEARAGAEGELVPPAPPPAEQGSAATERYSRYLQQVDQDRRAQAAADEAEAARLRAAREATAPAPLPSRAQNCAVFGASGECLDSVYPPYVVYPYPVHRPVPPPVRNPEPPPRNPRSTRPPVVKTPADVRREILAN